MEKLLQKKDLILEIKNKVENDDSSLYSHNIIANNIIDEKTISIVMTSSNRSKQTYFTLKSISNSEYKNVQIILVDDSDHDPINIDTLKSENYNFYIDLININRVNKTWLNPLVNYNIGFKFIKGTIVVIQNAEVCHIGDVLSYINFNVINDNYYVFDVKASSNFDTNEIIYNTALDIDIYNKNLFQKGWWQGWYQSTINYQNLHFLTCLSKYTFDKIKNFSYDLSLGVAFDDNDFLLKIISKCIKIINIWHDEYKIGGLHLHHDTSPTWNCDDNATNNGLIFKYKKEIYESSCEYVDII